MVFPFEGKLFNDPLTIPLMVTVFPVSANPLSWIVITVPTGPLSGESVAVLDGITGGVGFTGVLVTVEVGLEVVTPMRTVLDAALI